MRAGTSLIAAQPEGSLFDGQGNRLMVAYPSLHGTLACSYIYSRAPLRARVERATQLQEQPIWGYPGGLPLPKSVLLEEHALIRAEM